MFLLWLLSLWFAKLTSFKHLKTGGFHLLNDHCFDHDSLRRKSSRIKSSNPLFQNSLIKLFLSSEQLSMGLSMTLMFCGKEFDWLRWWSVPTASTSWVAFMWPQTVSSSRCISWSWTRTSAVNPALISSLVGGVICFYAEREIRFEKQKFSVSAHEVILKCIKKFLFLCE